MDEPTTTRIVLQEDEIERANNLIDSIMSPQAGERREQITFRVALLLHQLEQEQLEFDCAAVCIVCAEGVTARYNSLLEMYVHTVENESFPCTATPLRLAWDAARRNSEVRG